MHCLLIPGGRLGFASYYGDHMVLQKKPSGAVVWGHGTLGAVVTVTLSGASGLIIMEKTAQVKGQSQSFTRNWGRWFWWPKNLSEPKSELMVG